MLCLTTSYETTIFYHKRKEKEQSEANVHPVPEEGKKLMLWENVFDKHLI